VAAASGRYLDYAKVAAAPQANAAVAPLLAGNPVEGGLPIAGLVYKRREMAVGVVLAAAILHHDGVAASDEPSSGVAAVLVGRHVADAVIGRADENGGEWAWSGRQVDIGRQGDAVFGGNFAAQHGFHGLAPPGVTAQAHGEQPLRLVRPLSLAPVLIALKRRKRLRYGHKPQPRRTPLAEAEGEGQPQPSSLALMLAMPRSASRSFWLSASLSATLPSTGTGMVYSISRLRRVPSPSGTKV